MDTAIFTKVFADRSLGAACERAAEVGYDAVELMGRDPHLGVDTGAERARELRALLDDLGLDVAGIATYTGGYVEASDDEREAELRDLEAFCELADALGTDLVRHNAGGPPEHRAAPADYEVAAEWMRRAADRAAEHGKRLGIEIHAGTITETAASTRDLLDRIGRENVGAIHDAGNMYIAGADYGPESVATLGDRLFHVHVKDERRVDDPDAPGAFEVETARGVEAFQHRLLGEGAVDHGPLVGALADAGYDGFLSNECHRPTDGEWTDVDIADHELAAMERLIADATG